MAPRVCAFLVFGRYGETTRRSLSVLSVPFCGDPHIAVVIASGRDSAAASSVRCVFGDLLWTGAASHLFDETAVLRNLNWCGRDWGACLDAGGHSATQLPRKFVLAFSFSPSSPLPNSFKE